MLRAPSPLLDRGEHLELRCRGTLGEHPVLPGCSTAATSSRPECPVWLHLPWVPGSAGAGQPLLSSPFSLFLLARGSHSASGKGTGDLS